MKEQESVRWATHEGITIIEFFHPRQNILSRTVLQQLLQAIEQTAHNPESKVILLRSAGETFFCAGWDDDLIRQLSSEKEAIELYQLLTQLLNAMRLCPKLIIICVQGCCQQEGICLVGAADYAIASVTADLQLSYLARKESLLLAELILERRLGHAAFSELAIDEKKGRNAEWGRRNGIYAELYNAPDTMEEGLFRLLKFLSLNNSEALAGMKKVLWNDAENWTSELPRIALESGKQLWTSLRQQ